MPEKADNKQVQLSSSAGQDVLSSSAITKDDIQTDRPRWRNRATFVVSTVGCAIGLGNVWKFPYLTSKHGGLTFLMTYLLVLFIVGIPMLILELTLGQKMQRGSAGSMRGIVPRLAGIGWVSSWCGFVTSLSYSVLLGICLVYLIQSGSKPWAEENFDAKRPIGCRTAQTMPLPSEELYFYQNVVKLYANNRCGMWQQGDASDFAGTLYISTMVCWLFILAALAVGPKLIESSAIVSVPLRFVLLIIFVIQFAGLNSSVSGDGQAWYLTGKLFPLPLNGSGVQEYRQFSNVANQLFADAYSMVFFSLGVCFGTMFAYGSYNKTRKPVICDAFIISILDLLFSFVAGFGVWGGIGYLQKRGLNSYDQTNSVGLIFIAMPAAAVESGYGGTFGLLCFTLWLSGLDSAVGFVEGAVTNVIDHTGCRRWQAALGVSIFGMILTTTFTTNWGWILFDIVDHYISDYIVISIGLCQCIAVGWIFERESTSSRSEGHRKSMRALAVLYWFPVITMSAYSSFGLFESADSNVNTAQSSSSYIPPLIVAITTINSFIWSYYLSGLPLFSWYHEIVMCGTDKIAMSITSLSNDDQSRSWWMLPFEAYFGFLIKFVNPACFCFFLFASLAADIKVPFGLIPELTTYGSIYVYVSILIIFGPMMMCSYPEIFHHNVEKEFCADDIFETKARIRQRMTKKFQDIQNNNMAEPTSAFRAKTEATTDKQTNPEAKAIEMTDVGGLVAESNTNKVTPAEQKPINPIGNDTSEVPETTALVPEAKAEVPSKKPVISKINKE